MKTKEEAASRAELLRRLRDAHPAGVARARALLKEQKQVQDGLVRVLREKPRTVPEAASALGLEPREVLWYLAAMRKYNLVVESGMSGDYPVYQLAEAH
ncbi:MAG TPA: hypothetical protein VMX54_19330 [Vicinamibacteria bacterium]|nr:hypothetical protein [Vicinamibacteria bacterium]